MLQRLKERLATSKEAQLAGLQAKVEQISSVRFLGITAKTSGSISGNPLFGSINSDVIYAFLIQYNDQHRELYHGKRNDAFVNELLNWIEM